VVKLPLNKFIAGVALLGMCSIVNASDKEHANHHAHNNNHSHSNHEQHEKLHDAPHHNENQSSIKLSDNATKLLREEMQHIQSAMQSLVPALAQADWPTIKELGKQIKHTFIFKQKMSEHELHQLHVALPQQFQELDSSFHHYAGMLSHVAEEADMELTQFYFSKMMQTCASCHSRYASQRFPQYLQKNKHKQNDHH